MKPNFALTLSFEGIGLLHRAFPGWHLVDEVSLDNDDLVGALQELRSKATALDGTGLRSKLVIPNDQIKYLKFEGKDVGEDALADVVAQHLDGATPYAVPELAYDWSVDDKGTVHVAAVARETLNEAEAFALEHDFNPLSFVAIPENGNFFGEPHFGDAAHAEKLLSDGEEVERDTSPIRIIGSARLPGPEAEPSVSEPEPSVASSASSQVSTEATPDINVSEPANPDDAPYQSEPHGGDEHQDAASVPETDTAPELAAFASIRAHRGDLPTAAPRLDGAERNLRVPPAPPEEGQTPDKSAESPEITGIFDDTLPVEESLDFLATLQPEAPKTDGDEPELAETRPADPVEPRKIPPVIPKPNPANLRPVSDEAQRMTVFGARDTATPVGGKPRHLGLILTFVLLLFLVGVAAWASIFLDNGLAGFFRGDQENQIVDATDDGEMRDPDIDIAALPQDSDTDRAPSQPNTGQVSDDEARARYAATGIWLMSPETPQAPVHGDLDDFYQTSIDSAVISQDAVALPDPSTLLPDGRLITPNSPADAGTEFTLDERGLVIATTGGALTPEGIRVYAGRPAIAPTAFPERALAPEPTVEADPEIQRLATKRPKLRPGNLSEQNERGNLSGRTRNELATLRPKMRPQSAREAAALAEQPKPEPFVDLDAVNQAITSAVSSEREFTSATPQAVSASLKPLRRPRNFDTIVKRSKPSEKPTVAVSAAQKVTPRIPTSTSVAKQATQRNALKLRKINLIGVYGTPNSRRALVRLANGRYQKVKVGDRLDGGKVSAIGSDELLYRKSGRNLVLKLPKG